MTEPHEEFDYYLQDCFPNVEIAGITFSADQILFECDPIAYRAMLNDWMDAQCSNGLHSHDESEFVCDFCGLHIVDLEEVDA